MRFVTGVLAGLVSMTLLWIGLILGQVGRPAASAQWVWEVLQRKEQIAEALPSPKIIVAAGSNVLFGIDAKEMERRLGIPVINLGVNAALQLPYILESVRKVVRRGDIVLLPLEPPDLYRYEGTPNFQMISFLYAHDPRFFWKLSWTERWRILWATPLSRVIEGYLAPRHAKTARGLYSAANLDERGDQLHNEAAQRNEAMQRELERTPPKNFAVKDMKFDTLSWRYLERFARWARKKGVTVFLLPSVMRDYPRYHAGMASDFLQNLPAAARHHGLCYLGRQTDFLYPDKLLFNTPYHLTAEGRRRHTEKILKLLLEDRRFRSLLESSKSR